MPECNFPLDLLLILQTECYQYETENVTKCQSSKMSLKEEKEIEGKRIKRNRRRR